MLAVFVMLQQQKVSSNSEASHHIHSPRPPTSIDNNRKTHRYRVEHSDNEIPSDVEIDFVREIHNAQTGETHQCRPGQFKYLSLILSSLLRYKGKYSRHTTAALDRHWDGNREKGVRLKIINGSLYAHSARPRGGLFMFLSFFQRLLAKYGAFVPDTDFIFGWNDGKVYTKESNWLQHPFPFFISEGTSLHEADGIYPLYLLSRGWLKQEHTRREMWLAECWHRNQVVPFERKRNAIEFRGNNNGVARKPIIEGIHQKYGGVEGAKKHGYDVSFSGSGNGLNVTQELQYKFTLLIDGISVRDAMHKQSLYGSVHFKDVSVHKEWWYYDLVHQQHVVYYDSVENLTQTVDEYMKTVREYEVNGNSTYAAQYAHLRSLAANMYRFYKENLYYTRNIDCFVIHMLQIYNEYLFDTSSLQLDESKDSKFCFDASCHHFEKKQFEVEMNEHAFCPYDNITDRFCQFCL